MVFKMGSLAILPLVLAVAAFHLAPCSTAQPMNPATRIDGFRLDAVGFVGAAVNVLFPGDGKMLVASKTVGILSRGLLSVSNVVL